MSGDYFAAVITLVGDHSSAPTIVMQSAARCRNAPAVFFMHMHGPRLSARPRFEDAGVVKDFSSLDAARRDYIMRRIRASNDKPSVLDGPYFTKRKGSPLNTYTMFVPVTSQTPAHVLSRQFERKLLLEVYKAQAHKGADVGWRPTDVNAAANRMLATGAATPAWTRRPSSRSAWRS